MFELSTMLAQIHGGQTQGNTLVDTLARTPLSQIIILCAVLTVIRLAMMNMLAATPVHKRSGAYGALNFFNGLFDAVAYAAILIFFVVRPYAFQAYQIPTGSMLETLQLNDLIGINKAVFRYSDPKHGDIVVFRPPPFACTPSQLDEKGVPKIDFIKRCIGVPGDLIEVKNFELYRNGQKVDEPYIRAAMDHEWKLVKDGDRYIPVVIDGMYVNSRAALPFQGDQAFNDRLLKLPAEKIPPGHYLMMGDNRPDSFDGRMWGLITREQVVGRSDFIWFPLNRWRGTGRG